MTTISATAQGHKFISRPINDSIEAAILASLFFPGHTTEDRILSMQRVDGFIDDKKATATILARLGSPSERAIALYNLINLFPELEALGLASYRLIRLADGSEQHEAKTSLSFIEIVQILKTLIEATTKVPTTQKLGFERPRKKHK